MTKSKKSAKKTPERHSTTADERARRAYEPAGHASNDPTIPSRTAARDEPEERDHRDVEEDERTPKDESRRADDQERVANDDAPIERDSDEWSRRASHDAKAH